MWRELWFRSRNDVRGRPVEEAECLLEETFLLALAPETKKFA